MAKSRQSLPKKQVGWSQTKKRTPAYGRATQNKTTYWSKSEYTLLENHSKVIGMYYAQEEKEIDNFVKQYAPKR